MIRGLALELRADAGSTKFRAAVSTGLIMSLLILVCQPSLAAIIFTGPLTPFVGQGTGAILFGSFAMCLIAALSGTYRGTISLPHFAPAAALFTIGGGVAAGMLVARGEAVFVTMIVIIALSTLSTGFCFFLIGHFRLARFLRFMPYPLVGGFLAGLGWFLSLGGIAVACGITPNWETFPRLLGSNVIWKWVPSVIYALGLLLVTKLRSHYLIVPGSVVLAIGLCHAVLYCFGVSMEEARRMGILFVGMPAGATWPPVELRNLADVNWSVVASRIPSILGVTLIALIGMVLNADALELGSGVELDMDREFRAEGAASLVAGLGGGSPGCNTAGMSLMSHATGAETRLTGVIASLAVGLVLFFGSNLLAALPTALLGGLLLFVGFGLLNDWLLATRKTFTGTDYGMVLAISLVICVFGFLEGVGAGLAAAVIFFVVRFSGVDVIDAVFTGSERHSKKIRSATHRAILREQGGRVHACRLRGYIIFGNASPMGDRLKEALRTDPPPLCLLLDFAAVSGFDASAANVICRSIRATHARRTRIVLSAMPTRIRLMLRHGLLDNEWQALIFEEDLDLGLERCEDLVIGEWDRIHAGSEDARHALFGLSIDHAMRELDRQAHFESLTERLGPWLRDRAYAAGETIVALSERQEGMQFLIEGRAVGENTGTRVDEYGPGDVLVPQAVFGNNVSEVAIVAMVPCQTLLMTPAARQSLERDELELTVELDKYLIETILERQTRLPRSHADRS